VSEFMAAWARLAVKGTVVENCFLLGAACTVAQYERDLVPALDAGSLKHLTIYNLSEQRELDDSVGPYSKSLLYLVSHAFEESPKTAILGMAVHSQALPKHKKQTVLYTAGADLTRTDARSHGGYGTDLATLNDILKTIRGSSYQQSLAFRQEELDAA
jgi:hypothetical protein